MTTFVLRTVSMGFVLMSLVLAGCSMPSPASVSGEVRIGKDPLTEGGIRLFPVKGTKGQGTAAPVAGGRYAFPVESRLAPGRYTVEIFGWEKTGRKVMDRKPETGEVLGEVDEVVYLFPEGSMIEGGNEIKIEPGENARDFVVTRK